MVEMTHAELIFFIIIQMFSLGGKLYNLYNSYYYIIFKGWHGGAVVSAVASQQSESRRFCGEFACSPRVRVGLLRVLRFPLTVQKHVNWG